MACPDEAKLESVGILATDGAWPVPIRSICVASELPPHCSFYYSWSDYTEFVIRGGGPRFTQLAVAWCEVSCV
jgi:hypothetical protein